MLNPVKKKYQRKLLLYNGIFITNKDSNNKTTEHV